MREYGQIQCSFWTDPDIQSVSDQAKALACYLLTGPHSNGLGCYRLPDGYIQADFGWSAQTVSKAFGELFQIDFCERCESTYFVLIPKYLKWNPISNGNVASAREKEFRSVPSKASIYQRLAVNILEYGKHLQEGFKNRLETLSEGYGKQDPTRPDPTQKETRPDNPPVKFARREPDHGGEKPTWTSMAREVFIYWQAVMGHPRAKFNPDDARIKAVIKQLKAGYSVDELKRAVDGCSMTPHNMGENDRGQRYDGLNVVCKNGDNVDRFIRTAETPDRTAMGSAARKTATAAERWLKNG